MSRAYASTVLAAPVETVWKVVGDYGAIADWLPALASCTLEDGHGNRAVGSVRTLLLADGGGIVRERLLRLDDIERSYSYCFVDSPFPVRSYVSTIRCSPVTDQGHTFVEWYAAFDTAATLVDELTTTFGDGVFASGLAALHERSW
ncbi:MAG TPA: SRPBCC family protein [Actinopolymorphaceae bacterium]